MADPVDELDRALARLLQAFMVMDVYMEGGAPANLFAAVNFPAIKSAMAAFEKAAQADPHRRMFRPKEVMGPNMAKLWGDFISPPTPDTLPESWTED